MIEFDDGDLQDAIEAVVHIHFCDDGDVLISISRTNVTLCVDVNLDEIEVLRVALARRLEHVVLNVGDASVCICASDSSDPPAIQRVALGVSLVGDDGFIWALPERARLIQLLSSGCLSQDVLGSERHAECN